MLDREVFKSPGKQGPSHALRHPGNTCGLCPAGAGAESRPRVRKVRLTGGEPLLRRDLDKLVAMLAGIDGIRDITLTTNGALLAGKPAALAAAGLRQVTVSLDSLAVGSRPFDEESPSGRHRLSYVVVCSTK